MRISCINNTREREYFAPPLRSFEDCFQRWRMPICVRFAEHDVVNLQFRSGHGGVPAEQTAGANYISRWNPAGKLSDCMGFLVFAKVYMDAVCIQRFGCVHILAEDGDPGLLHYLHRLP